MSDTPSQTGLNLTAQLEALLFAAPAPVTVQQLAAALDLPTREVTRALNELSEQYQQQGRGLQIQQHQARFQLTTAPKAASVIERLLGLEASSKLSRAALEVLAIVAYQQPVTRPQIDAVRGVSSDGALKNLLNKGLIHEAGRSESAGRPILYATTADFLQHFGLNSLEDLPTLQLEEQKDADLTETSR